MLKKKAIVRMMFKNTETFELEVDNPHIAWFIVEVDGKQEIFTKSRILKSIEDIE